MTTENIENPSLSTLPIELIFHILNNLDVHTILFSFGNVCKRFRSIMHSYNQYKLNFQSVSKPYFHSICNLIRPENVISLTLSNGNQTPNQISLFLSLFQFEQFSRLRSITLIDIDEEDFNTIFQCNNIIQSLSFNFAGNFVHDLKTLPNLSSAISNVNLRCLSFTLFSRKMECLSWPNPCFLQSLKFSNFITFKQFSTILSCSLQLKKLVIQDCRINDIYDIDLSISYPQLISLTFEDSELNMKEFQKLLSLTPSLEHLHIIGGTDLFNGLSWEQFIQKSLIKLEKFDFAFCGNAELTSEDTINVESLINSFRTPFWIEKKRWFVIYYYFKGSSNYSLYSLPICKSRVKFYPNQDKISCSTYPNFSYDPSMTDNVQEMQLNLTNLMSNYDPTRQNNTTRYPFFRKLNKLMMLTDGPWPDRASECLSTFINLSSITDLFINFDFDSTSTLNDLTSIKDLFTHTTNLNSLIIDTRSINAQDICSLIPDHVKHLQVSVRKIDDMKLIVEKLDHLLSIAFEIGYETHLSVPDFVIWLAEQRNKSTYTKDTGFLSIWFDKK